MKTPPLARDTLRHFERTAYHMNYTSTTLQRPRFISVNHGPLNHRTGAPRDNLLWAQCIQKSHTKRQGYNPNSNSITQNTNTHTHTHTHTYTHARARGNAL
jgi:hypothetical protein